MPFLYLTASHKVQNLGLRAISWNYIYAVNSVFFEIAQALILNFSQSRQIATFYGFIKFEFFKRT